MTGRRSSDKWTKWIQSATVGLAILFVVAVGYGLSKMFNEIKIITAGQQELILNLAQKSTQEGDNRVGERKVAEESVSKISFIKFQNDTSREIKALQKKIDLLEQKVRSLKNPL